MLFHWSLSESKSSQVSKTFLSILDSNAVVLIVSICPLIFNSSSSFSKLFEDRSKCNNDNWGSRTSPCCTDFLVLGQDLFFFTFFDFHSVIRWDGEVHYSEGSFLFFFYLFINYHYVWSSGQDQVSSLYIKCWMS